MTATLQRFSVTGLHSRWSFDVKIKDNRLILVGENGQGKTTLINLMFYFLSGQWSRLAGYDFQSIEAQIEDQLYLLPKADIDQRSLHGARADRTRFFMKRYVSMHGSDINLEDLHEYCARHHINPSEMLEFIAGQPNDAKIAERTRHMRKNIVAHKLGHILYLPTYRRIEQDLKAILPEFGPEERRVEHHINRASDVGQANYIELVKFGMEDVKTNIQETTQALKDFVRESLSNLTLTYLREVIDGKYKNVQFEAIKLVTEKTVDSILYRIDERILPQAEKSRLKAIVQGIQEQKQIQPDDRIIAHFFLKLLDLHKEQQQREMQTHSFVNICNEYLTDKKLIYNSNDFEVDIYLDHEGSGSIDRKPIPLSALSSGEKQIVSLFSHLYLSKSKSFFVFIDEPELSLSVKWQKRFVQDISSATGCVGLVAVTHSPFIFDNSLDIYAHALDEFRKA